MENQSSVEGLFPFECRDLEVEKPNVYTFEPTAEVIHTARIETLVAIDFLWLV